MPICSSPDSLDFAYPPRIWLNNTILHRQPGLRQDNLTEYRSVRDTFRKGGRIIGPRHFAGVTGYIGSMLLTDCSIGSTKSPKTANQILAYGLPPPSGWVASCGRRLYIRGAYAPICSGPDSLSLACPPGIRLDTGILHHRPGLRQDNLAGYPTLHVTRIATRRDQTVRGSETLSHESYRRQTGIFGSC